MTVYLGDKAVGVNTIVEKEVAKTKFGASVDTWIGDVDENGVLQKTTWTGALNFAGVKEIRTQGLYYAFYGCTGITSVDLSSLQSVVSSGLAYAFHSCTGITSVDLSSLQSVGLSGLNYAFYGCTGITSVDLSSLQSVENTGLQKTFQGCSSVMSVDLSNLSEVSGAYACQSTFYGCEGITRVDFPALTVVSSASALGSSSTNGMFAYCNNLAEIHFRADAQATIEALSGYSSKFGAKNATIYFDL